MSLSIGKSNLVLKMILKRLLRTLTFQVLFLLPVISLADSPPAHLQLVDFLDRPADRYCFDVMGVGANVLLDMPLFAHNCKSSLAADATIIWRTNGHIEFPAYGKCVTAAGVNQGALPGAALMLRDCNDRSPFINAAALQRFVHLQDERIQLHNSKLCITAGKESSTTYSIMDSWRTLYLQKCDQTANPYAIWKIRIP